MPNAEELLPLPLPVSTNSTPRSCPAAAMRASIRALRRCMRSRMRSVCPMHTGHLTQRRQADIRARHGREVRIPANEINRPTRKARGGCTAAEPIEAAVGKQKAHADGHEDTGAEAADAAPQISVPMSAGPSATEP